MTSPTPCTEQRRFLESLGFEELKDHDTDFQVAWIFRNFYLNGSCAIMLPPDELPTAREVLEHFGEAAYRKGVADTKRQFQEALKGPCVRCNGARYVWVRDPNRGTSKQVKCSACNP